LALDLTPGIDSYRKVNEDADEQAYRADTHLTFLWSITFDPNDFARWGQVAVHDSYVFGIDSFFNILFSRIPIRQAGQGDLKCT